MQVNIQHVFDQQEANCDSFHEFKTLNSSIISVLYIFTRPKKHKGMPQFE